MRDLRAYDGLLRCATCRSYKPFNDFALADMSTGSRQYKCRVCHAAYRRAHYLANKPDYIRRAIAQVSRQRAQNRVRSLPTCRHIPAPIAAIGMSSCSNSITASPTVSGKLSRSWQTNAGPESSQRSKNAMSDA